MKYGEAFVAHKDEIIKNFSPAKVLENVLTEEQVKEILLFAFQNTNNLKWTATSSNLQPTVHITELMKNTSPVSFRSPYRNTIIDSTKHTNIKIAIAKKKLQ